MKIKFLALAAAMMISTTSFAQFSQSESTYKKCLREE